MSSQTVLAGRVHSVSTVPGSRSVVTIEVEWPERLSEQPFPKCGSSVIVDLRGQMARLLGEARDELRGMGWRTNRGLLRRIEAVLSEASPSDANADDDSLALRPESPQ